jgi:hypothetical protein
LAVAVSKINALEPLGLAREPGAPLIVHALALAQSPPAVVLDHVAWAWAMEVPASAVAAAMTREEMRFFMDV